MLGVKQELLDVVQREMLKPKRRGRPSKTAPLSCAICGYETHDLTSLKDHTLTHSDKNMFGCPHCGVMFTQRGNLAAHIRTHTRERPFTCQLCPFAAAQRGNLVVHIRKHTKEKPYRCHECDFAAAQVANLRSHLQRKHGHHDHTSTQIMLSLKMYKCSFCKFVCRAKKEMTTHCQIRHAVKPDGRAQQDEIIKLEPESPPTFPIHFLDIANSP